MKESSFIKDVRWYEGLLYVTLKSGMIYEFEDVPESVYTDFIAASSLGKFFARHIKNKYVTESFEESTITIDLPFPFPISGPPAEGTKDVVNFDEYLEWTEQEEAEFLAVLNDPENDGMNGATT